MDREKLKRANYINAVMSDLERTIDLTDPKDFGGGFREFMQDFWDRLADEDPEFISEVRVAIGRARDRLRKKLRSLEKEFEQL